jgi:hypothetical protein
MLSDAKDVFTEGFVFLISLSQVLKWGNINIGGRDKGNKG